MDYIIIIIILWAPFGMCSLLAGWGAKSDVCLAHSRKKFIVWLDGRVNFQMNVCAHTIFAVRCRTVCDFRANCECIFRAIPFGSRHCRHRYTVVSRTFETNSALQILFKCFDDWIDDSILLDGAYFWLIETCFSMMKAYSLRTRTKSNFEWFKNSNWAANISIRFFEKRL